MNVLLFEGSPFLDTPLTLVSIDYLIDRGLYVAKSKELTTNIYFYTKYEDSEMVVEIALSMFSIYFTALKDPEIELEIEPEIALSLFNNFSEEFDKFYCIKATRKKEDFFSFKDNLSAKVEHIEELLKRNNWFSIKNCNLNYEVIPF
jgi:hypothetical protein